MENELFEWKDWDEVDTAVVQFTNCRLLKDLPCHKEGEYFEVIVMDYSCGIMILQDRSKEWRYKINLTIERETDE